MHDESFLINFTDFQAPDKNSVLMTLNFSELGIYGCTPESGTLKNAAERLMGVTMYCETVSNTSG